MVIIKENDILSANSYLPLEVKEALTRLMARLCIEKTSDVEAGELLPTPPLWRENRMRRQQFLMGVLAGTYLKKDYKNGKMTVENGGGRKSKQDINYLMSIEDFDLWGESHVMNQLERLKRSKTKGVADGVFDILQDFRVFENMLLGAIRDELEAHNNSIDRVKKIVQLLGNQGAFEGLMAEFEKLKAEIERAGKDE